MDRLRHDVAWATSIRILEILNLRAEEGVIPCNQH